MYKRQRRGEQEEVHADLGDDAEKGIRKTSEYVREEEEKQDADAGGVEPLSELELAAERNNSNMPDEEGQGGQEGAYAEVRDDAEKKRSMNSDEVEEEQKTQADDKSGREPSSELDDVGDKDGKKGQKDERRGWTDCLLYTSDAADE